MQVCTACTVVPLLTTCMNFNTPPLSQIAPFEAKFGVTRATQAFRSGQLHLDHSRVSKRSPWLVYKQNMVPKKRLLSLCHLRASLGFDWALKVVRQVGRSISIHEISYCLLLMLCFASARCCHDPFIVRSASNLSTVPGFHSVCASVLMITINTYCFCFCFCFCVRTDGFCADVAAFHQHHRLHQPSSCSGVCRIPILRFEHQCNTEAEIGFVPTFAQFFTFLILTSSSRTCSCIPKSRTSLCSLRCLASNRSVKEFSVSPAFNAVTL